MNRVGMWAVFGSTAVACALGAKAAAPAAVPELLWYKFDEPAGSATTQNFAVPGVGFTVAPVHGQQLGGGVLTGVGGGSGDNYVETGWDGATGTSSFSVYFKVINAINGNTTLDYFFGNNSVGQRAFDDGVAGDTGIAFRFGGGAFATAFGASTPGSTHEVAFVFDTDLDTGFAYVDGLPVDSVAGLTTVNVTAGEFKVGGYWTNTFNALQQGTQLDDFRVYSRALSADELIPAPPALTVLLLPALLTGRRRHR